METIINIIASVMLYLVGAVLIWRAIDYKRTPDCLTKKMSTRDILIITMLISLGIVIATGAMSINITL